MSLTCDRCLYGAGFSIQRCEYSMCRFITLLAPNNASSGNHIDLRTLRAVRVLRPLKLVSGVPSKYMLSLHLAVHCNLQKFRLVFTMESEKKYFIQFLKLFIP
jgi:hypothetical protein